MNITPDKICPRCNQPVPPSYSYCPRCGPGQAVAQSGWELTLHNMPPQSEAAAAKVLADILGIGLEKALWRLQQPGRLLAVGLDQNTVWRLKSELRKLNVLTMERLTAVRPDPFPGEPAEPVAARPPVVATPRISLTHQVIMPYAPIVETRTVVGLNLGRMNSCLAFTRAQGDRLLALPSMVPFDGQTLLPTVVVLKDAAPALMGRAALRNYVLNPESVTANFINTPQLAERQAAALAFLKAVCARLTEVTGAGRQQTLHISLGNPLTQESGSTKLLVEWINQTGMQVDQVVPEPLAVLAAFLQQQKLKPLAAGEMQHILVLDGGSSSFRVACVERLDNGELTVIDNQELLPAGPGFDQILWEWLTRRLPAQPDDQTLRELALFTQDFKVQMSRSFAHGKAEHAQFCMLTGQASPLHITIRREEFEQMAAPLLEQLSTALSEAPARIGLQCSDIAYILLAGGGAGWYFLPEMVQKTMCQAPLKEAHPEETIARGLAVYGLKG